MWLRRAAVVLATYGLVACDAGGSLAPTDDVEMHQDVAVRGEFGITNVYDPSEPDTVDLDMSTLQTQWVGSTEIITMSDVLGNDYEYRAYYNASGAFYKLRFYINAQFVGEAEKTSYGSINRDPDAQWAKTDNNYVLTTFNNTNPYEGLCPNGERFCEDDPMLLSMDTQSNKRLLARQSPIRSFASLEAEIRRRQNSEFTLGTFSADCDQIALLRQWGWELTGTIVLLGASGASTAATISSGGLTGWVAAGAWWSFINQSRTFWRTFRELENCRRQNAGLPPRL